MILKSLYLKNILLKKIIAYYEVYSIIIKKEKLLFCMIFTHRVSKNTFSSKVKYFIYKSQQFI